MNSGNIKVVLFFLLYRQKLLFFFVRFPGGSLSPFPYFWAQERVTNLGSKEQSSQLSSRQVYLRKSNSLPLVSVIMHQSNFIGNNIS